MTEDRKFEFRVRWSGFKVDRKTWIRGMQERHPTWAPQTAVDLADLSEASYAESGLTIDDWAHIWIYTHAKEERDSRYDPLWDPSPKSEWFLAGGPDAGSTAQPTPSGTTTTTAPEPPAPTKPKRKAR